MTVNQVLDPLINSACENYFQTGAPLFMGIAAFLVNAKWHVTGKPVITWTAARLYALINERAS